MKIISTLFRFVLWVELDIAMDATTRKNSSIFDCCYCLIFAGALDIIDLFLWNNFNDSQFQLATPYFNPVWNLVSYTVILFSLGKEIV
jgi:hypothetical protein